MFIFGLEFLGNWKKKQVKIMNCELRINKYYLIPENHFSLSDIWVFVVCNAVFYFGPVLLSLFY